ncbi:GNAT family N-acetyltransferase [Spiractinospora alimapuensis]|uniref:GNAT family N-acetyltransferase n=1 Tax=Spiractinospora alimapuensis TaxID=2820884 RepID=UPI001F24A197|nr:GNAT family protein [Spiractinospora alimapuensis]QVQ51340.1 GNAT family N-acetyltransferase [Spiractinospora alimapuensis]
MSRIPGWPVTLREGPVGLRPMRMRDAGALRETRRRNMEWLRPWEPTLPEPPLEPAHLSPYVAMIRAVRAEARRGMAMPWAITYEDVFAGQLTVGAITWGSARNAQIGYWIDERFAGKGATPTAVALAVDHCFFTTGLHRVEANVRPENGPSRRVAEKLGFREEGIRRRQLHIDGAWRDHICYALTIEDVPHGLVHRWRQRLANDDHRIPGGQDPGTSASSAAP